MKDAEDYGAMDTSNWKPVVTRISRMFYWELQNPVPSSLIGRDVTFSCLADGARETNDLAQFDFEFIAGVAGSIDVLIEKAIAAIKAELQLHPSAFGIKVASIDTYVDMDSSDFPVGSPRIIFYTDRAMNLIFEEAGFPYADEGVMVEFSRKGKIRSVWVVESNKDNIVEEDL